MTSPETKAWIKKINARQKAAGQPEFDESLYGGAQPHYTAAPVFAAGVIDPLKGERVFLFKGTKRMASPPAGLAQPSRGNSAPAAAKAFPAPGTTHPSRRPLSPAAIASSGRGGEYSLRINERLREAEQHAEHFHQECISALVVWDQENGPLADPVHILARLWHLLQRHALGPRGAAYVEDQFRGFVQFLDALRARRATQFTDIQGGDAA